MRSRRSNVLFCPFAEQICQFVCKHHSRRNSDRSWPVLIHVAQSVSQRLQLPRFQLRSFFTGVVLQDSLISRVRRSLSGSQGNHLEVIRTVFRHVVVNDSACRTAFEFWARRFLKFSVNSLVHNHVDKLDIRSKSTYHFSHFTFKNRLLLSLTDTVSLNDHLFGSHAWIQSSKCLHRSVHTVSQLWCHFLVAFLRNRLWIMLTHIDVQRSSKSQYALLPWASVLEIQTTHHCRFREAFRFVQPPRSSKCGLCTHLRKHLAYNTCDSFSLSNCSGQKHLGRDSQFTNGQTFGDALKILLVFSFVSW